MEKYAHQCTYPSCQKRFTNKYSLQRHMASHNVVRRHACEICGKTFALLQYLKEHAVVHSGRKPYACPYPGCTKAYRQAGKLSIHKKRHTKQVQTELPSTPETPANTIQELGSLAKGG